MNEKEASMWMSRLVEAPADGQLPDPALIWWKARLLDRQTAQARALRPVLVAQWFSLVVPPAAAIILCAVDWPGIRALLASF